MNKKNAIAMLLIIASSVIGVFVDTSAFLKVLSGIIAALAFAVLFNWLPVKNKKK